MKTMAGHEHSASATSEMKKYNIGRGFQAGGAAGGSGGKGGGAEGGKEGGGALGGRKGGGGAAGGGGDGGGVLTSRMAPSFEVSDHRPLSSGLLPVSRRPSARSTHQGLTRKMPVFDNPGLISLSMEIVP